VLLVQLVCHFSLLRLPLLPAIFNDCVDLLAKGENDSVHDPKSSLCHFTDSFAISYSQMICAFYLFHVVGSNFRFLFDADLFDICFMCVLAFNGESA
jgi:hypothetical protein